MSTTRKERHQKAIKTSTDEKVVMTATPEMTMTEMAAAGARIFTYDPKSGAIIGWISNHR